jgi:hypothetical protein
MMFLGIEYIVDGEPVRIAIDRRDACVPVATRGGGCVMMLVGHTETVLDQSPGRFQSWPEGNTVSLDTLRHPTGPWVRWRASVRPVKIAVSSYFYADELGFRRQHELASGEYLQGALLAKRAIRARLFCGGACIRHKTRRWYVVAAHRQRRAGKFSAAIHAGCQMRVASCASGWPARP